MKGYKFAKRGCVVAVAILIIFGFLSEVKGADWVYYGDDSDGNKYFYDRSSIRNVSEGIVEVWDKKVFTKKGRLEEIKIRQKRNLPTEGFDSWREERLLQVINCVHKKVSIAQYIDYAIDGRILKSGSNKDITIWGNIAPGSVNEALMEEVCKKAKK